MKIIMSIEMREYRCPDKQPCLVTLMAHETRAVACETRAVKATLLEPLALFGLASAYFHLQAMTHSLGCPIILLEL